MRKKVYSTIQCTLEYWVAGRLKETILVNQPRSLCNYKRDILSKTTHRTGKLVVARAVSHE